MMISIVFYQMSVSSIQDEIEQSNMGKLEQVKDIADARLEELQQIAHRISMDHRLTPYMFTEPYYSKLAINELTTYSVNSSIVDSLFLYYYGQENIYSSRGVNTIDIYTDVYQFASYEIEQLKREMETLEQPTVRSFDLESASEHVIAYMFPISSTSLTPYGTVVFLVKEDIFTNLIHHALGHFEGNIYIFNREQERIASYHNSESSTIIEADIVPQLKNGISRKQLNGEDYSLVSTFSDESQWTFVTAMPTKQFYAKMDALKSTIITILTIIAIIGMVSTFYMAIIQYRPIHGLNQKIKTIHGKYFSKQSKDEIARIQESIQMMHENSEQLQEKMKVHEPYLRDQIVIKLINGDAITLKEQKELLEDLQLQFKGKRKFIFVVSLKEQRVKHETLLTKEKVLEFVQEISLENGTGYGVELIHDQAVGVIVDMQDDHQDPYIQRNEMMEAITDKLSVITAMELKVGVGGIYEEISRMNRSFIEAKAAIDYALIHSNSVQPVYFEQIAKKQLIRYGSNRINRRS